MTKLTRVIVEKKGRKAPGRVVKGRPLAVGRKASRTASSKLCRPVRRACTLLPTRRTLSSATRATLESTPPANDLALSPTPRTLTLPTASLAEERARLNHDMVENTCLCFPPRGFTALRTPAASLAPRKCEAVVSDWLRERGA